MTIQFPCTQCQTTLSAPDGSTGKKARCPKCGNVQVIPAPAAPVQGWRPEPAAENPYASPSYGAAPAKPSGGTGDLVRQRMDFGAIFGDSWNVYTQKLGPLLLLMLIVIAVWIAIVAIDFVLNLVQQGLMIGLGGGRGRGMEPALIVVMILFGIVRQVLSFLGQTWIAYGVILVVLPLIRFNRADYGRFFAVGPYFGRALLTTFLTQLIGMVPLLILALVVVAPVAVIVLLADLREEEAVIAIVIASVVAALPGYVLSAWIFMRLLLAPYFIIDRNAGVIESLKLSDHYMTGNKLTAFLVLLVLGLALAVAVLVTCFFGAIIVIPFSISFGPVLMALMYLTATGQWQPGSANQVPNYS